MADETPDSATGETDVAEPDAQELPPLMIGAQYIRDLSFENPQGPEVLAAMTENPKLNFDVSTSARQIGDNVHEVT